MVDDDIRELKEKYENKLKTGFSEKEISAKKKEAEEEEKKNTPILSRDYYNFKQENMPAHMTLYEKLCKLSENLLKVEPDKKKLSELEEAIRICHLQVTPQGVTSFSLAAPIVLALSIILVAYILPFMLFPGSESMFFVLFAVFAGLLVVMPLQKLPIFLANNWRMKASNQMVLCIFYMVTYMRHTSNLERAMTFAAEHLTAPLSLDLKKVIWDVESEKYQSLKESLDSYLHTWRKYNMEFIESMHLIESSLFETSEGRRLDALDKSLKVILEETYEKMLHFAHNLKGPLTALHMLGVILPILGLVILPLMVSFMPEVKWYHLAVLYNLVLPISVYYLARNIISTRPTGYGESDISETNPELRKYRNIIIPLGKNTEIRISPLIVAIIVGAATMLIGLSPLLFHAANPNIDVVITGDAAEDGPAIKLISTTTDPEAAYYMLGYRDEIVEGEKSGKIVGPFGIGALLISFFVVLSVGFGVGLYFKLRSKNVIKIRDQSKALEQEFAAALFQLGNRLADGLPAEIAFGKVAEVMEGTLSGQFFELVSNNISRMGMSVEQAIFDEKKGALIYYPSNLIESSMKVLVESSKKGPMIASQAVINVSEYIKQIHRVDERLKDLMADIVSDMRSQVRFLTPAIAGIVVGITSMITQILGSLSMKLSELSTQAADSGTAVSGASLLGMFGTGIPTYYFQIVVGLYVVQITFILTILLNGIENGSDKLSERYLIGNNLVKTTITYLAITIVVSLLFNFVAGGILSSFQTG